MNDAPSSKLCFRRQGYSGPVPLELFRSDLRNADPFEVAKVGAEKVRRLMAEA